MNGVGLALFGTPTKKAGHIVPPHIGRLFAKRFAFATAWLLMMIESIPTTTHLGNRQDIVPSSSNDGFKFLMNPFQGFCTHIFQRQGGDMTEFDGTVTVSISIGSTLGDGLTIACGQGIVVVVGRRLVVLVVFCFCRASRRHLW
jgi:hypothetical protein